MKKIQKRKRKRRRNGEMEKEITDVFIKRKRAAVGRNCLKRLKRRTKEPLNFLIYELRF